MPLPRAQINAFLNELAKIDDKNVAKALNKLLFQPSDEEVAAANPQLQAAMPPAGAADLGNGQSSNVVGNSQIVNPAVGPGGV